MIRVFGVNCTLVYPSEQQLCTNCTVSGIGGISNSVYRHGGPAPFNIGYCPLCNGQGSKPVEVEGTVKLRVYWTEKDWKKVGYSSIQVPDGSVMTLGYLSDMPELLKTNELIVNSAQSGYANWRYRLSGEPFAHGFGKNRYCAAFWSRSG